MTLSNRIATLICALALAGGATYASADPPADKKMGESCPMMQDGEMPGLTTKVENTATGAIVRLTAKTAADAPKVQALAAKLAKHLESGCEMMHGTHGKHDHGAHGGHKH